MTTSNQDISKFISAHAAASPLGACVSTAYVRADIDRSPSPEFLRYGGEGHGHPVLLAVQIEQASRQRVEHGTGHRWVEKFRRGAVRAWRFLPFGESARGTRRELLALFQHSNKVDMVAATAIWSTPLA